MDGRVNHPIKSGDGHDGDRGREMAQFTLTIPNEFLPALDELVVQTQAGSRDAWIRNVIGNMLVQYQIQKELAPQARQREAELVGLWR